MRAQTNSGISSHSVPLLAISKPLQIRSIFSGSHACISEERHSERGRQRTLDRSDHALHQSSDKGRTAMPSTRPHSASAGPDGPARYTPNTRSETLVKLRLDGPPGVDAITSSPLE